MNHKILPYVNFLLDNEPSPFCDYIICKELLLSDDQTIRDAYAWAKQFKLYTELYDEQFPDGSWSDFFPMDTSAEVRKKHKHTKRHTLRRLNDLSLDSGDEMVAKTIGLCKRYVSGDPKLHEPHKLAEMLSVIYTFSPDDELVRHIKEERTTDNKKQRVFMEYNWERGPWDLVKLSDLVAPDNQYFEHWMRGLEDVRDCFLFGEYMADKAAPFLLSLCERLIDPKDTMQFSVGKYYGKVGQYSETRSKQEHKKKDLLLRIIRLLNRCG